MDVVHVQPALDEVNKVLGKLGTYFTSMRDFLDNPSSPPPSFSETVTPDISVADTLGVAYSTKDLSSNKASGYIVDATNMLSAAEREAAIRGKSKASYYFDALDETSSEVNVYSDLAAEYKSGMMGNVN